MANEFPKDRSEASREVLKSGCMVCNCINTAMSACIQYATALYGALATMRTVWRDFFGISLATTVVKLGIRKDSRLGFEPTPTLIWDSAYYILLQRPCLMVVHGRLGSSPI